MKGHDVYLAFEDFIKFGRISSISLTDACEIFARYEDQECRGREGVRSCWITMANSSEIVLGTAPKNWSPNEPVYENAR